MKILLVHVPEDYFKWLKADITRQFAAKNETPDLVHLFAKNNAVFEKEMKNILLLTRKNSALTTWVSWYKKSSGVATDITEDMIRNFALKNGLVDIKVCAVSEEWSGLKLVVPVSKR